MLETGDILQNRYEILKPIGQGGMGAVYTARDQRLGNTVALKETFFSDDFLLAAFEREAKILAGLRHGALPKVIDHFADADGHFLVMEYISGNDLQDLLEENGPPSVDEVLQWADQLLDALDYLHSQQPPIIHRDIKPQNLKLTSRNQVVLLDFGLAKGTSLEATKTGSNSNSSIFGYTPGYAPLEQAQGSGTDAQSDIYSLAATLYHLLTGTKPFDAVTRATSIMNGEPDPLVSAGQIDPKISPSLSDILTKGMSLKKSDRPSSAAEMRRMLRDSACSDKQGVSEDAHTILPHTLIDKSNTAAALSGSSTRILSSSPTTPAGESGNASPDSSRSLATNNGRAMQARVPDRGLNRRPMTAAQWPSATVNMASDEHTGLSKVIVAGVVLVVAVAALVFVFRSGAERESTSATPVIIQTIEQPASPEQSGSAAKTAGESSGASSFRAEPVVANDPSVSEERASDADNEKGKADDVESKETAKQEEPAQESERARAEPAEATQSQPPPGQPAPRPESVVRQEPPRPMPPPPHMHRPPPYPPREMPPPPRRRP